MKIFHFVVKQQVYIVMYVKMFMIQNLNVYIMMIFRIIKKIKLNQILLKKNSMMKKKN